MALYVLKFGGSSVATTARIRKSAEIVANVRNRGHLVAVVTSAMQGVTNQLIDVAKAFCDSFVNREYDAIISSGEQVAAGLFALCLGSIGISAKSMLGWQIPIRTSGFFSQGFISSVNKDVILNEILTNGTTPVIAGFQGISDENEIMTIGRGGSDATACAVSCAIGADECFIYTDVDGVYTADPRVVLNSKRLTQISYDEMLVLASLGAKVLQDKSVCIAKQCGVKLRVLSSFSEGGETIVTNETTYQNDRKIAGIAHNTSVCIINISGDFNGSELTERLYFNKINLEFISFFNQNLSFLIAKTQISDLKTILDNLPNITFEIDNDIGVVSIVGSGIKTDQAILKDALALLNAKKIKLKQIAVSDMAISLVVPLQQTEILTNKLHKMFFEKG